MPLALLLTACTPPAPPTQPAAESPAAQSSATASTNTTIRDPNALSDNPAFTWDDVDQDPELIGRWFYTASGDGAFTSAAFGGEETEASFTWVCNRASRTIALTRDIELTPDQPTGLGIITPGARYVFDARSFNEGLPNISAQVRAIDPRLDAIAASAEGFAVQAAGDTTRIRHDAMLQRVLADCRS
ncbi:hypothetical protein [Terricaulis silvestris]|nr:hypothetical protein [Terricaulis silvestris]